MSSPRSPSSKKVFEGALEGLASGEENLVLLREIQGLRAELRSGLAVQDQKLQLILQAVTAHANASEDAVSSHSIQSHISDITGAIGLQGLDAAVNEAILRGARVAGDDQHAFAAPLVESQQELDEDDGSAICRTVQHPSAVGPQQSVEAQLVAGDAQPAADAAPRPGQAAEPEVRPLFRTTEAEASLALMPLQPQPPMPVHSSCRQVSPAGAAFRNRDVSGTENRRVRVAWAREGEPSNSASVQFQALVPGTVDHIRQQVDQGIVARMGTPHEIPVHNKSNESQLSALLPGPMVDAAARGAAYLSEKMLRLGGVLPWRWSRRWPTLAYQVAVLMVHAGSVVYLSWEARLGFSTSLVTPFFVSDLVLAVGSALSLFITGMLTGRTMHASLTILEEAGIEQHFQRSLTYAHACDALVTFVVWLAFLSERLGIVYALSKEPCQGELLHFAAVLLSSGQMAIVVLAILRVARGMRVLVDSFCTSFAVASHMGYSAAVESWNLLQATVRMTSSAAEWGFVVVQSTLVLLILATVFDVHTLPGTEWALTSSGLLILGMCQILLAAAAVTDACVRVPQLVNSTTLTDDPLDPERKYLVDYITASSAGFYIFNVRVGSAITIKVVQYSVLMALTTSRLVIPGKGL